MTSSRGDADPTVRPQRPRRRWRRRLGLAAVTVVLLLVVGLAGGLVYARPLLKTGTGYAAHNACAVRLVAGRGADQPERDLPPNPLVPYLRTSVSDGSARSSVLGVLYPQTAYFVPGRGCTVADRPPGGTAGVSPTPVARAFSLPVATSSEPAAARDALDSAVARAFGGDAQSRQALGTRAVVVVHHGHIVAERYADGFTADTRQLGWSMGKSVTNLMAGRLVQEGKLSLGDSRLRPEWTDARAAISVENLLRMTSGLEWDETYALGTPITRMLYLERDMGGYAASLPSAHAPGTYQQYSSGTTNILCQVLEQRSGQGEDVARQLIFEPLGLASAVWEPDAAGHPVCSSYLWATPRDWASLGQFALQQGVWNGQRLLPEGWMTFSTSTVGVQTEDDGFAAHWWVNRRHDGTLLEPGSPADAYWASGHDGQRLAVVPSADLVVLRLGFTPEGDDGADHLVADVVKAVTSTG